MELTEFLLARIAEDEAVAREAVAEREKVRPDWTEDYGSSALDWPPLVAVGPERWLAEVEAKRRLVELHRPEVFEDAPAEAFCTHDQRTSGLWPCPTMRLLALPYAGHPGYDPAWEA